MIEAYKLCSFSADTFRKRIEPIKEKIPKHVLEVIEEELANLDRKEYGFGSTDSIYSYLDWLTALPWGNCRFAIWLHMFMVFLTECNIKTV